MDCETHHERIDIARHSHGRNRCADHRANAEQLESEHQRIEVQRKQLFDANNPATQPKQDMPSTQRIHQEMERIEHERKAMYEKNNPATKNAPNIFPNIPTPQRAQTDIESIAKKYEQKAIARKTDNLMVFASFTMPKESLKRLVSQAHQIGASVVLRGFKNNDLKTTAFAINELKEQGGNIVINPNAFTKYKVQAVPTIVLAKADTIDQVDNQGCALPDHYVAISGDVSLDYALEAIAKRAPPFQPIATAYLRQLKGKE